MQNKLKRWFQTITYPAYVIFFVTSRCNANCKMCFYKEHMESVEAKSKELTLDEYEKISKSIKIINILGISGGEPFLRTDLSEIIKILYRNCSPLVVDLPTNGFFVDNVLRQAEDVAKNCPEMIVDLQLSIDGPSEVHNDIRGLKDSFARMKETYSGLVLLKKKYSNLKVKACSVYSHYNEDYIEELFGILERDFLDLDRKVFSVVHGSVSNHEAFQFSWDKYFTLCEKMKHEAVVKNVADFHSLFTIALRFAKNDFLKQLLMKKDMYKVCGAGKRVIVINELGQVFPCEPIWTSVGDLRQNGYDLDKVLESEEMKKFQEKIIKDKCNCHWGLPMSTSIIYKPEYYPGILADMIKMALRSSKKGK